MTRNGFSRSTARPFRITSSSPSQFDYSAPTLPRIPIAKPLQAAAAATSGARYVPPFAMTAHAMRAILLATATATNLAGFLAKRFMIQRCFSGCRRACWITAVAPMTSNRLMAETSLDDLLPPDLMVEGRIRGPLHEIVPAGLIFRLIQRDSHRIISSRLSRLLS